MDIPSYILGRIKGSGGAGVNYVVVDELPTAGEEGTIYLVPKEDSQTDNVYNEYMYIEDEWELIGDTQADLSNYVQNTDYASLEKGGVVKPNNGFNISSSGETYARNDDYTAYQTRSNQVFISKGTLENVINGKGLITQYSTLPTASADNLGKIVQYIGTTTNDYTNGYFYQCVSDGQETPTYSWQNIEVQASSGGGSNDILIDFTNGVDTQANRQALAPLINDIDNFRGNIYLKRPDGSNTYYYIANGFYTFSNNSLRLDFSIATGQMSGNELINKVKEHILIGFNATTKKVTSITRNTPYTEYTLKNSSSITTWVYKMSGLTNYSTSNTYNAGDYVLYQDNLYVCNHDGTTGSWNWSYWTYAQYINYLKDTILSNS